jgi:hypothetical protein
MIVSRGRNEAFDLISPTSWVGVDLPKVAERLTAQQVGENNDEICHSDDCVSCQNSNAVAVNTVLQRWLVSPVLDQKYRAWEALTVRRE